MCTSHSELGPFESMLCSELLYLCLMIVLYKYLMLPPHSYNMVELLKSVQATKVVWLNMVAAAHYTSSHDEEL